MMRPLRRFGFRLALALGIWDVDGMLRAMPSSLLNEWLAFDKLEPFGQEPVLAQMSVIGSLAVKCLTGKSIDPKRLMVVDYERSEVATRRERQSPQEIVAFFRGIARCPTQ